VTNFFNNWDDLKTLFNSMLQLNGTKSFQSAGRVLVNTTAGLLGFVDVATKLEVPRPQEDFGQTLGYWGVGKGPFLMIPLLGPSNLRDGVGSVADFMATSAVREEVLSSDVNDWIFLP
jgi:phospholipid-binding lipoprotein MlaA